MTNKNYLFLILIVLGIGLLLPIAFTENWKGVLDLSSVSAAKTGNILAQLGLYALIVERVTEVYVNTMFNRAKANLTKLDAAEKQKVMAIEASLKYQDPSLTGVETISELNAAKMAHMAKREAVKADDKWIDLTDKIKKHASIFGMSIGIVLGLVGARVFGSIGGAETLSDHQSTLLAGVDVLLTGMLLAGGANGLHPLINKIKTFTTGSR